ncbi:MAG: hypothetical protein LLF94_09745 [Chlamydiales bacterium]|nr:hypothetical protein [Chlamydiales bacterium]
MAAVMVALWAYVTYYTGYQIGWVAVGMGCGIGLVMRFFGEGSVIYGVLGAVLSFVACYLGNLLNVVLCIAFSERMPILEVMQVIKFKELMKIYIDNFQFMDLVFYCIAIYEGFKLSITEVEEGSVLENLS